MFAYYVYEGGDQIAGFTNLATAASFIEGWNRKSDVPVYLVDMVTGEVVDIWANGEWVNPCSLEGGYKA